MIEEDVGERGSAEWDAYVAEKPGATCYQLSAWSQIARASYGIRSARLVSRGARGERLRGVLPLFVVRRPLRKYVTTGIFGAYGPLLADDEDAAHELFAAARRFCDDAGATFLHVKALGDAPAPTGYERRDVWKRATLSLQGGEEKVFRSFKTSMRAAIRQGLRSGLEIASGAGELEDFYDVLAENMHRKGAPIYGRRFFRELARAFGNRAEVVTLRRNGHAVAGAFTLMHERTVYIPFASARAAFFPLRPSNLLYWRIIQRASERGLATLDFGSSLADSSCLAFKRGWGATMHRVASYVYTPGPGHRADITPESAAVQAGVRLWQRLPRVAADALGPAICRYIV